MGIYSYTALEYLGGRGVYDFVYTARPFVFVFIELCVSRELEMSLRRARTLFIKVPAESLLAHS